MGRSKGARRAVSRSSLLTPADVSKLTGGAVAPSTVRMWDATGRLRALRTASGSRVFLRQDVLEFLLERFVNQLRSAKRR